MNHSKKFINNNSFLKRAAALVVSALIMSAFTFSVNAGNHSVPAYKIEHALSRVNPIIYLVVFFVVIRLLSGPLWNLEFSIFSWIISGVDWLFNLFGLTIA